MKRLLTFLFSLLPAIAWGATPTFDSFRQTNSGFIVNQPYIYVANTNTGGTNVIINGDVIYTNTTISYFVTTNFYDQSTIIITNSTVTITNSTVTINGTNVATINPTIGRIPFKFSDFQFGDSALYYIDTNTVGTTELDTDVLKFSFANAPTFLDAGENDIDVTDHSVLVLASFDPSAQLRLNVGNGNVTMLLIYHAGTTEFSLLNGDSLWDGSGGVIYLSGGDWHPTADGESMLMFKTPIGWSEAARMSANTNIITEQLWRFANGYLQPTDLTQPIFWTNSVTWGPGTTNTLGLDANGFYLDWTAAGGPSSGFKVLNSTSDSTAVTVDTSSGQLATSKGTLVMANGSENLQFGASDIHGSSAGISVGTQTSPFNQSWFATNYVRGFESGGGANYSQLAISHTGTNGAIVFDSQAAGSAGAARSINFDMGGTNLYVMGSTPSDPVFAVTNSTGFARMETFGGNAYVQGGNVLFVENKNAAGLIVGASDNTVQPTIDNAISLGGPGSSTTFKDIGLKGYLYLQTSHTPSSASDTGLPGAVAWDSSFVYVCTGTNAWKRAAIASW